MKEKIGPNGQEKPSLNLKDIPAYTEDGRAPLAELYTKYSELESKYGFTKELIYVTSIETDRGPVEVPVYGYKSAKTGPALWVISGVHGEEPAGPNAIAQNIDSLGQLGQEVATVIIPLLNPLGYCRDWRYPNEYRDSALGQSVSDSEHYLPDLKDPEVARAASPSSEIAAQVTKYVLETIPDYPPVLTVDHHEDEDLASSYIYSQGPKAAVDEAAKVVIDILKDSDIPLQLEGFTRFGELVKDGVVIDPGGQPVKDGSIDELLAAEKILIAGIVVSKPHSRTSLVIETPTIGIPLEIRVSAHSNILVRLRYLFQIAYL